MIWPDVGMPIGDWGVEAVGSALAALWINYGTLVLLGGSLFLVHGLLLAYLVASFWRPSVRVPAIILPAELLYGLVNPVVYLVIIERSSIIPRQWILSLAGSVLLAAIWGCRLALRLDPFRSSRPARLLARGLSIAAVVAIAVFLLKDLTMGAATHAPFLAPSVYPPVAQMLWGAGMLLSIGALYAIPAFLAVIHLGSTMSEPAWSGGRRFFVGRPWIGWSALALVVTTLIVAAYHPSEERVQRLVLDHRVAIIDAAGRHAIDPALIASIVYVTRRELTSPFADRLERAAMAGWLVDPKNNFFLAEPLDVSVGLAQIKPLTAMAALVIQAAPHAPPHESFVWATVSTNRVNYKEYRGLPRLDERWKLPAGAVDALQSPFHGLLPKRDVVDALFDDRRNIQMCALILALYAVQWEAANPAWSVRRRPEILATLYQIGFEKSWPKPDPRPNRFGQRVGDVYRSPFIQRTFGPAAA